jgi:hypothetical protein
MLAERMRALADGPPEVLAAVTGRARLEFDERFRVDGFQRRMIEMVERAACSLQEWPQHS